MDEQHGFSSALDLRSRVVLTGGRADLIELRDAIGRALEFGRADTERPVLGGNLIEIVVDESIINPP